MKNKKGLLLPEETLKIVLAVISILFLIGFLVALYFSYVRNKDLEKAESSLEHLIESIQSGATEVEIWNPKGWGVVYFHPGEDFPEACLNEEWESCICICQPPGGAVGGYLVSCNNAGACLESDFAIKRGSYEYIEIKNPPLILTIEGKTIAEKET